MAQKTSTPKIPNIKLNNGMHIPQLGLGSWESPPGEVKEAVKAALRVGYRHFDCAAIYGNEVEIGQALKEGMAELGLKRSDIWVTSKLWNTCHRPDLVRPACEKTLKDLQLDYLDMYLMHFPVDQSPCQGGESVEKPTTPADTFLAMHELVKTGLVKTIGVSNFNVRELQELMKGSNLYPAVNQIEMHPYLVQDQLYKFCQDNGITLTAYSPLGRASKPEHTDEPSLVEHPVVVEIAKKYNKTPAHVLLRWAFQHDAIVIPKSTNAGRIKQNLDIFDFVLEKEDMNALSNLNRNYRYVRPYFHTFEEDKQQAPSQQAQSQQAQSQIKT